MVFNIFGLSGLEQAAFFHNLGQMKEALPLNSILSCFETTPFFIGGMGSEASHYFNRARSDEVAEGSNPSSAATLVRKL